MTETLRFPTVADAAKAAIDVQDGCNASGISLSMHEVAKTLRRHDVRDVNRHPVMQLFAYKLAALCIYEPMDAGNQDLYSAAMRACDDIVAGRRAQ